MTTAADTECPSPFTLGLPIGGQSTNALDDANGSAASHPMYVYLLMQRCYFAYQTLGSAKRVDMSNLRIGIVTNLNPRVIGRIGMTVLPQPQEN